MAMDPQLQQVAQTDPELAQLVQVRDEWARKPSTGGGRGYGVGPEMQTAQAAVDARLRALGIDPERFKIEVGSGQLTERSWMDRNWERTMQIAGAAAPLAAVAIPAMAGLGAAGGGAASAAPTAGAAASGAGAGATGAGGFLSTLGKWAPMASNVASVLGGAAGGSADTAAAKSAFDLSSYGKQQDAQFQQGALDLQRKQFDETSESNRYRRALLGQLLGNVQDVNVSVPGITNATVSGGIRPSALGDIGRQLAGDMSMSAAQQAKAGNTYQGGQLVAPPTFSGGGSGFLNTAATLASLLGSMQTPKKVGA